MDAALDLPAPLEPLRASDRSDARVVPPTEELFPGGGPGEPWAAADGDRSLELDYAAGGAEVAVDGEGELRVALDGGEERRIAVEAPGLYPVAEHSRHEEHHLTARGDQPGSRSTRSRSRLGYRDVRLDVPLGWRGGRRPMCRPSGSRSKPRRS